jgi:hypothetical protein
VIGNEPNLPREWPNGQAIHPQDYAVCYAVCRTAIRQVAGHEQDEVLIAAPGPWNAEFRYDGNPTGDWLIYWRDVLAALGDQFDGSSLHAYTHGYDPKLVTSMATMDRPFDRHRFEFPVYQDYLGVIAPGLRNRPVYLTETNGNGPWQAVGLMPEMLREISRWNASGGQLIHAVIFYRWPDYDEYGMESKPEVIREFAHAARAYPGPDVQATAPQPQAQPVHTVHLPKLEVDRQNVSRPRIWDMRLGERGVKMETPTNPRWVVTMGRWLDEAESQGRHHIYVDVKDEAGNRVPGVPLLVEWPGGSSRIVTEAKPGEPYSGNYPMSASLNEFSIRVDDGQPSERVTGIGMGANGNAGIHTSTVLHFQRLAANEPAPPAHPPAPSPTPLDPPPPVPAPELGSNPPQAQATPLDPLVLEALIAVESGGSGFWEGRLKIRLEAHLLLSATYGNPNAFQPYFKINRDNLLEAWYRPDARAEWIAYHAGQDGEWGAFQVARMIDANAAIRCTSMGLGQVMGFHWQSLGYGSPLAMFAAMQRSEAAQLAAMYNYILARPKLIAAINARDWDTITRLYNGVGLEHIYTPRLQAAYAKLGGK